MVLLSGLPGPDLAVLVLQLLQLLQERRNPRVAATLQDAVRLFQPYSSHGNDLS